MIRDAVPARDVPYAEAIGKRNSMTALPAPKGIQTPTAGSGHDRFDREAGHVAGVVADMAIHATLRALEPYRPFLEGNVEDVKDGAQFGIERHHFEASARDVTHVK